MTHNTPPTNSPPAASIRPPLVFVLLWLLASFFCLWLGWLSSSRLVWPYLLGSFSLAAPPGGYYLVTQVVRLSRGQPTDPGFPAWAFAPLFCLFQPACRSHPGIFLVSCFAFFGFYFSWSVLAAHLEHPRFQGGVWLVLLGLIFFSGLRPEGVAILVVVSSLAVVGAGRLLTWHRTGALFNEVPVWIFLPLLVNLVRGRPERLGVSLLIALALIGCRHLWGARSFSGYFRFVPFLVFSEWTIFEIGWGDALKFVGVEKAAEKVYQWLMGGEDPEEEKKRKERQDHWQKLSDEKDVERFRKAELKDLREKTELLERQAAAKKILAAFQSVEEVKETPKDERLQINTKEKKVEFQREDYSEYGGSPPPARKLPGEKAAGGSIDDLD